MRQRALPPLIALAAVALGGAGCAAPPPSTSVSTLSAATIAETAPAADYCREYRSTAEVAGARQEVVGTACRRPDGSWQIVDGSPPAGTPPTVTNSTTTYVVPYPGYYGPYWPDWWWGPGFAFGAGFAFGGHHHHHHHHRHH
jgi:hypothetical protein